MKFDEYLDDILIDVDNKKIKNVISKLEFKNNIKYNSLYDNKILKIASYLINNDLTIYDNDSLLNMINMLKHIKNSESYFDIASIYYDLALKNQSVKYFQETIKYLLKSDLNSESYKILSDSYFYKFILSKDDETNILDLSKSKKYLLLSNVKDDIEFFKIEFNFCGYYLKNSLYKKAIYHGNKALKYTNDSDSIELLPELYSFLGLSYIKLLNYKKSSNSYKKVINLLTLAKEVDISLLKEALFNLAECYNALKKHNLELKTRLSLKNILDEKNEEDYELIYINSKELAYIEKHYNQLSYAIKDAKTSLKIARKLNVSLDRLYESILLVGYIYYDLENYNLYLKYLKDSIATAKLIKNKKIHLKLLSNSLNEIASYCFFNDFDESITYYLELKDLYSSNLDILTREDINDYVEAYLSIINDLKNKDEYSDALYLLEEIKSFIIKKVKEDESYYYELSMIYNRFGILYYELNENQKTIDYYLLAINTFYKSKSMKDSIILETYYNNLIMAYNDMEEKELAIDALYKKLDAIDYIYNGKEIGLYIDAKIDVLYEIINELKEDEAEAKKVYEEIISILENEIDIKTSDLKERLATAYCGYAAILSSDSYDDILAINYYEKAIEIYKQLSKEDMAFLLNIIYVNNSIAYSYLDLPDYDKSEQCFLSNIKAIEKYNKKYGFYDDFSYGIAIRGLALLYDQKEDVINAEKYYLEAIKIFENLEKNKEKEEDNYNQFLFFLYNNIIKFYDHILNTKEKLKYEIKLKKLSSKMSKN